MTFGAVDVVAPLTPVNDERVVRGDAPRSTTAWPPGAAPAAALAGAVDAGDGALDPTAAAFVVDRRLTRRG